MRVPIILLGSALILLSLARQASAGPAPTLQVDRTDDAADATACTAAPSDCSMRGAITTANGRAGEDTIVLAAGIHTLSVAGPGEDANQTGDLDVLDDIVITGAGPSVTILDGAGLDRVLDVDPSSTGINASLSALTITGGAAPDTEEGDGGGIRKNGNGLLKLTDVAVVDNEAEVDGGGVFLDAGDLAATNIEVRDNVAMDGGGGISLSGADGVIERSTISSNSAVRDGGAILSIGVSTIVETIISNNTARSGGAIWDNGSTITIDRSVINDNSVAGDGGALRVVRSMTVTNSTISGNSAGDQGGGIITTFFGEENPGTVNVHNSTIVGNRANSDSVAGGDGGGIFISQQAVVTLSSTILANNAVEAGGVGPECAGTLVSEGYNLVESTTNCTVTGNQAGNITGEDPMLGPLQDNGGSTETHELLAGSPAIDAGSPACPPPGLDQRGFLRPGGAACDIGAFEAGAVEGQQVIWGDHNCSGSADPVDALLNLRHDAGLPSETNECPEMGATVGVGGTDRTWGDLDCSGAADPVDGLKVLRFDAGLDVARPDDCPDPGEIVTVN